MKLKISVFLMIATAFFCSCSLSRRINEQIREAYVYNDGRMLGGDYVYNNRKAVFSKVEKGFLKEFDSLVLIEKVIDLERYYDCAVFRDSLAYFFQAQYLKDPQIIDLKANPLYKPELALYIFEKVKNGELPDILEQSENTTIMTPPISVFLTIVKKNGKKNYVERSVLNTFTPKEKLIERDSIKREIRQRSSNR